MGGGGVDCGFCVYYEIDVVISIIVVAAVVVAVVDIVFVVGFIGVVAAVVVVTSVVGVGYVVAVVVVTIRNAYVVIGFTVRTFFIVVVGGGYCHCVIVSFKNQIFIIG